MFSLDVDQDIKLVLVREDFAPLYFDLIQAQYAYLSQWLPWVAHAKSEQFFVDFINKCQHDYATGQSLVCGILYQDQLVGNISFNAIRPQLKHVDIGYWLSLEMLGRGIMTRAVRALIDDAFTRLDIEKVQISAAVENTPSRQVCERLGMTLEGIIRHSENVNGHILDHAVYGLYRNKTGL